MRRPRPTLRVRLTLLYTSLFSGGGAILVVITYALVASLPTAAESPQVQVPGGGVDRSVVEVPDRRTLESMCRQALSTKQIDPNLRDKCVSAYQVWGAQSQREATLSHLVQYSLTTLAAVVALAAVAGWLVSGRALRPVQKIAAAARTASDHDLSARVALTGPRDELRELADTFDEMLGRLEAAFISQERFIANASHELRTPLMVMRTAVDVLLAKRAPSHDELQEMVQDIREAVEHAEALIEALLTLARGGRGLTTREDIDLAAIAEDVLDSVERRDRHVHASLSPAITTGDPLLLERLAANLVDNAIRYNDPGGHLWIRTSAQGGRPTLVVANTGPVVSPESTDALFEPFHRLHDRTTRDGFGLGLAIVASIATMHHGTVTARPRPAGGLEIVVTLPASTTPWLEQPFDEPGTSTSGLLAAS